MVKEGQGEGERGGQYHENLTTSQVFSFQRYQKTSFPSINHRIFSPLPPLILLCVLRKKRKKVVEIIDAVQMILPSSSSVPYL